MSGRDLFKKIKPIINVTSFVIGLLGEKVNKSLLIIFRNFPFKIGILIRYIILKNLAKKVGDNVSIQPSVFLFNLHNVEFGNNVSIHPMCYVEGAGGISIGNNVSIAHSTTLISTNHTWSDISIPIKYNKEILSKIIVNDDVWIGCGVRVLAGVTIQSRCVIAAGAVVNKDVENNSVYGGIPARRIKRVEN